MEVCSQALGDPADCVTDRAGDPDIETPVEGGFQSVRTGVVEKGVKKCY